MSFEVTATRKRPQSFEALVGQNFVVSTLKNSIKQERIAHAYLFSGPRGVGKTTSARLLAKALNCEKGPTCTPCGVCNNCKGITAGNNIDVIEIDGASNTSVNDVRLIKEEIMFPPSSSRYKIYIIDEVHMLSQNAFNALLKTIEEPPEYVIFIFATTETQKVPATVRSRCQQFNFQLVGVETIKSLLENVAIETNTQIEENVLYWIAGESTGSVRDAYTLFDQVSSFSNEKITMQVIKEKLGLAGQDSLNEILNAVLEDNKKIAIDKLGEIFRAGVSVDTVVKEFVQYFRNILLIKEGVSSQDILAGKKEMYPKQIIHFFSEEQLEAALEMFLELYRAIKYSVDSYSELELAVSRLFRLKYTYSNTMILGQLAKLKNDLLDGKITLLNEDLEKQVDLNPIVSEPLQIKTDIADSQYKTQDTQQSYSSGTVATDLQHKTQKTEKTSNPANTDSAVLQHKVQELGKSATVKEPECVSSLSDKKAEAAAVVEKNEKSGYIAKDENTDIFAQFINYFDGKEVK